MIKVWIFKNAYYIGNDSAVTKNALRSEEIEEIPEGYCLKVKDGVLTIEEERMEDEMM